MHPRAEMPVRERGVMRKKVRTVVNLEIQEFVELARQPGIIRRWCSVCGTVRPITSAENAAELLRTAREVTDDWLKAGKVHGVELSNGRMGICLTSLLRFAEDLNQRDPNALAQVMLARPDLDSGGYEIAETRTIGTQCSNTKGDSQC